MIAQIFIDGEGRLRSGWRFAIALITVFGAFLVSELVARALTRNVAIQNMINRPVSTAIMLALFLWMSRRLDHAVDPSEYVGLGTKRPWVRDLAAGAFCGALLVSACVAVIALLGSYSINAGPSLTITRGTAVGIVGWVFIFGAITEELGFRSYPFYRLIESLENLVAWISSSALQRHARAIGTWLAILLLSGLFGAVHLANPNATFWGFADTVLIGIFFGLLMVRTGSLWLLWGLHFGWNFTLGALYGLPVSGINQFSVLWTGHMSGPSWLTGGAYGIEASATAAIIILIGILTLLIAKKPLPQTPACGI